MGIVLTTTKVSWLEWKKFVAEPQMSPLPLLSFLASDWSYFSLFMIRDLLKQVSKNDNSAALYLQIARALFASRE